MDFRFNVSSMTRQSRISRYRILNNILQVQPMGYDYQSLVSEMRDGLNSLKRDVKATGSGECPTCLSTTMFLLFIGIQMIILLVYSLYR